MKLTHARFAHWQLIILAIFAITLAGFFTWYAEEGADAFIYVSMIFYVLATASFFYETFTYKTHKPSARIAVSIMGLLLALMMFFGTEEPPIVDPAQIAPLTLVGFIFLLTVWVLFFMSIFAHWMLKRALVREGEPDSQQNQLQSTLYQKRYLPIGFYTKGQYLLFISLYMVGVLLSGGLYYFLQYVQDVHFLLSLAILFLTLLPLFFIIAIVQVRTLMKPFVQFETTLNYQALLEVMERYNANPTLHPETRNFLLILQANYATNYDAKIADELWDKVAVPLANNYRLTYDIVYLQRLMWQRDFNGVKQHAETVLGYPLYRKQAMAQKQLILMLQMNRALSEGTTGSEIERLWPLVHKRKLVVVHNLAYRVLYYFLRNDLVHANEYFDTLKITTPESDGLIEGITNLLQSSVIAKDE